MYKINEYEQAFNEDIREKKKVASGAKHRAPRGFRPITVHNQSDNLTAKELREMSGEVVTFMQKPIKWQEFKEMPVEAQKRYIEWLKKEYKATGAMISDMFGINRVTFCNYNKDVLWLAFPNSNKPNESTKKRWKEFCNSKKEEEHNFIIETHIKPEDDPLPCGKMTRCQLSAENIAELIELLKQLEPVMAYGSIVAALDVRNGVE